MRRTLSCDSGKLVLPRIYGIDPDIAISGLKSLILREEINKKKATVQGRLIRDNTRDKLQAKIDEPINLSGLNSFSPKEENDNKKTKVQGRLIRGSTRDKLQVKFDEHIDTSGLNSLSLREENDKKKSKFPGGLIRGSTREKLQVKINEPVDLPKLTLPAIPLRNGPVNNEERKRRRRIHCYDYSLQVQRVIPERNKTRKSSRTTNGPQALDVPAKRLPYVIYDQNYAENRKGEKSDLRDRRNILPLSYGILQGQRMNLLQKEQLNKQRKRYRPPEAVRRKKQQGQPLMWFF